VPFNPEWLPESGCNNLWYRPTDSNTVLIFVHGVLADSRSCWLCDEESGGIYWPRLIAEDTHFGNTGIYLGGYYTAIDSGGYEIRNAADELLAALNRRSVLARDRLIFICHSAGGLVVRYILTNKHHLFVNKTVGLVLLASPSSGSRWATRANWLTSIYGHRVGKQLIAGHWTLKDLDAQFKNLLNDRRIPNLVGIEAYENHFVFHRRWLPNKQVVVTEDSAGRYFGAPVLLRNTDHFTISKPTGRTHPSYELLADFFDRHFGTAAGFSREHLVDMQIELALLIKKSGIVDPDLDGWIEAHTSLSRRSETTIQFDSLIERHHVTMSNNSVLIGQYRAKLHKLRLAIIREPKTDHQYGRQ
jgi:pimeloyl-ACP methyl ester carboxylesterase